MLKIIKVMQRNIKDKVYPDRQMICNAFVNF